MSMKFCFCSIYEKFINLISKMLDHFMSKPSEVISTQMTKVPTEVQPLLMSTGYQGVEE